MIVASIIVVGKHTEPRRRTRLSAGWTLHKLDSNSRRPHGWVPAGLFCFFIWLVFQNILLTSILVGRNFLVPRPSVRQSVGHRTITRYIHVILYTISISQKLSVKKLGIMLIPTSRGSKQRWSFSHAQSGPSDRIIIYCTQLNYLFIWLMS